MKYRISNPIFLKAGAMKKMFAGFSAVIFTAVLVFNTAGASLYAQAAATFSDWNETRIGRINVQSFSDSVQPAEIEKFPEIAPIYFPEKAAELPVPSVELPKQSANFFSPAESKPRVKPVPVEVAAVRVKKLTEKLEIFAQALMDGNIKGLAAKKYDEFMTEYLFAGGLELSIWLEETREDFDFQKIFKGQGPWILVLLAMSPASMHEYLDELDMPGGDSGALDAKRLPFDMYVRPAGEEVEVEVWGDENLSVTFRIDGKNRVRVV